MKEYAKLEFEVHFYVNLFTYLLYKKPSWFWVSNNKDIVLNSTFPDTNCIIFFQINPTLDKYFTTLKSSTIETVRRRPGKLTEGVLFHQDNAPAWTQVCGCIIAAVRDCGFELVDHPPHSPGLAPSDYFLFPNLK